MHVKVSKYEAELIMHSWVSIKVKLTCHNSYNDYFKFEKYILLLLMIYNNKQNKNNCLTC